MAQLEQALQKSSVQSSQKDSQKDKELQELRDAKDLFTKHLEEVEAKNKQQAEDLETSKKEVRCVAAQTDLASSSP